MGDFNVVLLTDDCKGWWLLIRFFVMNFLIGLILMIFVICLLLNLIILGVWKERVHRIHRRLDRALCNGVCLDE